MRHIGFRYAVRNRIGGNRIHRALFVGDFLDLSFLLVFFILLFDFSAFFFRLLLFKDLRQENNHDSEYQCNKRKGGSADRANRRQEHFKEVELLGKHCHDEYGRKSAEKQDTED